jgi:hypothetical protein
MEDDNKYTKKDMERARWEGSTSQQLNDVVSRLVNIDDKLDRKADLAEFRQLEIRIEGLEKKVYIAMGILGALQFIIPMSIKFFFN